MQGVEENGNIRFDKLPLGEEVTLVGILIKDGSPHLAIQETIISKEIYNNLQFQKVNAEELKQRLRVYSFS
ncbi:hypothetical protein [Sporocytophaga myxococcoides]|uniref:hypothetical protein n=1 Tax=Sporocytophaga myxococcoides TaxID=153721 RepID=UPI000425CF17|nr:hypothetical protein [Sporocytophaga myxococcoides]